MLSIASPVWVIPAAVLILTSVVIVARASKQGRAPGRIQLICALLKATALTLLAVCLVEPVWSGTQPKPKANLFVVLADNSRSLTTGDAAQKQTVATQIQGVLEDRPESWLKRLEQDFELHRFAFDRRLRSVGEFTELEFDGDATALDGSLGSLSQRFANRPVAGVLLLSDGNATDVDLQSLDARLAGIDDLPPIYPVKFAAAGDLPDVAIVGVSVSQTPFEDAPVSIQCDVELSGFSASRLDGTDSLLQCRLIDSDGLTLQIERSPLDSSTKRVPFRFQFRPVRTGVSFYRLHVAAVDVGGDDDRPLDEITTVNNARTIQIDRGSQKKRVLYVSGRPNWEFKFLRRALEEDEQVDLVGMIRVAKREAKFDFRGRDGQSSNSLFRGFKGETDEETENYDEPVIVRLNTKDAEELRAGFPKDAEGLFAFDALILDDIEVGFFVHEQLALIERFVSERGGGLLMLGGTESFQNGGYDRTPVADALPVYLDRAEYPAEDVRVSLDLTREGWLQPWVRLRSNENDERTRLAEMPGFQTVNPSQGIKPGASVMATVRDEAGTRWPALVTQQFGRGRAGAMLIGDLWRWQLQRSENDTDDLAKAWRQTVRWLVADVPQRVELKTEPALDVAPEAVRVRVRVVDEEFRALDNARVQLRLAGPVQIADEPATKADNEDGTAAASRSEESTASTADAAASASPDAAGNNAAGNNAAGDNAAGDAATGTEETAVVVLDAEASLDEPGVYSAVFVPKDAGAWTLNVNVVTNDGEKLVCDEAGHIAEPDVAEFRSGGVNDGLLARLAEQTGGELVSSEQLDEFVTGLASKPAPVQMAWTMPLWDQPIVFLIVLCCLVADWGLRRTRGLP
jgi:uncharacterized membrane protein